MNDKTSESEKNARSMRETIEEHGGPARARWREVFDEMRADGEDNDTAAEIADDVIRKEVERGVLDSDKRAAFDRRTRAFFEFVDMHERDGRTSDSDRNRRIADAARDLAREFRS